MSAAYVTYNYDELLAQFLNPPPPADRLTIEYTADEAKDYDSIAAIFQIENDRLTVVERARRNWPNEDPEDFNDADSFASIPIRIWREALPWIKKRIRQ